MRSALTCLAIAMVWSLPAYAASESLGTYTFRSFIVPQPMATDFVRDRQGQWGSGVIVTETIGFLDEDVALDSGDSIVSKDILLGFSSSMPTIACTINANLKFRLGKNRVCFIDADSDGKFDHWFRRADEILFTVGVKPIPVTRFLPIRPTSWRKVDLDQSRGQALDIGFQIEVLDGKLSLCRTWKGKGDGFCFRDGPKLALDGTPASVQLLGSMFNYNFRDQKFHVQVIRPLIQSELPVRNH